jgi:hypothetical protein
MATYREAIENKLDTWYRTLGRQELQSLYGVEEINQELIDLWYDLPIDSKLTIYDESN